MSSWVFPAYVMPMTHTHATRDSFMSRIYPRHDGGFDFRKNSREFSGLAVGAAHGIVLHALQAQAEHFGIDGIDYTALSEQFDAVWHTEGET
jgi:hypothetical protein